MKKLTIVEHPAEILTTPCEKVTKFDDELSEFIEQMFITMEAADGVGLAAPQVNCAKQVAVVDVGDEHGRIELINPVVLKATGSQTGPEGCLSFPGLFGEVNRPKYIKIKAQDRFGKPFLLEANDFLARALLHEIDHLHGILFTEKVIRYYEDDELEFFE